MHVEMDDESPIKLERQLRDLVIRQPQINISQPKIMIKPPPKVVVVEDDNSPAYGQD
jgi:hypothetical protein